MSEENEVEDEDSAVTEADLKKWLPKGYKLPKGLAARADLMYELDKVYKEKNRDATLYKAFLSKFRRWFIQELPAQKEEGKEASGIAGKLGRVQIKEKEVPTVEDWGALYKYIKKNDAFDLLGRKVNAKAVAERWDNKKVVPGVNKFMRKSVSLTKVK